MKGSSFCYRVVLVPHSIESRQLFLLPPKKHLFWVKRRITENYCKHISQTWRTTFAKPPRSRTMEAFLVCQGRLKTKLCFFLQYFLLWLQSFLSEKKNLISLRYKQHSTSRSIVVDALLHLFFATLEIELNRFWRIFANSTKCNVTLKCCCLQINSHVDESASSVMWEEEKKEIKRVPGNIMGNMKISIKRNWKVFDST